MESIERLREFVSKGSRTQITTLPPIDLVTLDWRDLTKLIDEIEEEFKEQELAHAFAHSQVYEFANGIKGQLLDFEKMEEKPEEMAEHGWVKGPLDADGVPIHIGDELECIEALHPEVPARFKVQDMLYRGNGEWHLRTYPATYDPKKCRHHHKQPTVEDVLRDFAEQYAFFKEVGTGIHPDLKSHEEVLRQFAAKLRLAGDE